MRNSVQPFEAIGIPLSFLGQKNSFLFDFRVIRSSGNRYNTSLSTEGSRETSLSTPTGD